MLDHVREYKPPLAPLYRPRVTLVTHQRSPPPSLYAQFGDYRWATLESLPEQEVRRVKWEQPNTLAGVAPVQQEQPRTDTGE